MHDTNIDRYYRPELDLLRFLAFSSVFTVHRLDHVPIDPVQQTPTSTVPQAPVGWALVLAGTGLSWTCSPGRFDDYATCR
jgi:hypothetical protein